MKDIVRELLAEEKELVDYSFRKYETAHSKPWRGYYDYIIEINAPSATKEDIEDIIKANHWDELAFPYSGGTLTFDSDKNVWNYHFEQDMGD